MTDREPAPEGRLLKAPLLRNPALDGMFTVGRVGLDATHSG